MVSALEKGGGEVSHYRATGSLSANPQGDRVSAVTTATYFNINNNKKSKRADIINDIYITTSAGKSNILTLPEG